MKQKIFRGIVWAALIVIVALAVNEFVKWLRSKLAQTKHEAKEEAKEEMRAENGLKFQQLKTDLAATSKALREENHDIARLMVDEMRAKLALPAKTRPLGPAGFGGAQAEPI